ncbi:MAG: tetratricopeptide repeat protein, partial [Candidatus Eremiobacterota bacterium]
MGNKNKARQILDHFLINSYPQEDTLIELVRTIDNPDEKTKILEKYIRDNPLWHNIKVHLINSLIRSKQYSQAQSLIDEILKKDPENITVIGQKTAILVAQGKLDEIEKYLSELSPGLLEHPDILYRRGLVRQRQGKDGEAFTYYKKAKDKSGHSENPELMLAMARLLWEKSDFYEAKELYIKVINRDKNNFRLKKELGCNLYREGFYEESIIYLKEAVHNLPDDPEILKNLGLALGERKNYQEALGYLVKYSRLSPGDLKILKVIGRFYARSDNFIEAKECLQKYISAFPGDDNGRELLKQVMIKAK